MYGKSSKKRETVSRSVSHKMKVAKKNFFINSIVRLHRNMYIFPLQCVCSPVLSFIFELLTHKHVLGSCTFISPYVYINIDIMNSFVTYNHATHLVCLQGRPFFTFSFFIYNSFMSPSSSDIAEINVKRATKKIS